MVLAVTWCFTRVGCDRWHQWNSTVARFRFDYVRWGSALPLGLMTSMGIAKVCLTKIEGQRGFRSSHLGRKLSTLRFLVS